jgi:hypothetical protein
MVCKHTIFARTGYSLSGASTSCGPGPHGVSTAAATVAAARGVCGWRR